MIRAFMEGAAYALYQNFLYIKESGVEMKMPMMLVEGGAKSALWRQIIADVFDIPVAFMSESKGAPFGNAVNAGVGVGIYKEYSVAKDWVKISDYHQPNPQVHQKYMEYYAIFDRLYSKIEDEYTALAKATGYQ
jgi:Sugar (pentulose and hexulose) kinases